MNHLTAWMKKLMKHLTDILTIKIPYELATHAVWQRKLVVKYETNQVIRALDTWLVLKADSTPSYIQNWNSQKAYLLKICKCSETIFRHRMKLLQSIGLASFNRHHIRLVSWDQLEKIFSIDAKSKLTIQYNINDNQKIYQWIAAAEIKNNQSRQAYMILKQVNKNPELNIALTNAMIKDGADSERLNDADYFLSRMKSLYLSDFIQVSEIHSELINVRSDTNRGVRGIRNAWKMKSAVSVSYWKKIMQKAGIIDISKLQVQSEMRVRNKYCTVLWLKDKKETLLCLCDQITILEPWLIEKMIAA